MMQVQVDIEFGQLVRIAKNLPESQWQQLKNEVENESDLDKGITDLEKFLLAGPTLTEKELSRIEENRRAINQWRTKQS